MACESTSTLTIKRRSNMQTIFEKSFTGARRYFEQVQVLTHHEGLQTYIFYTMSQNVVYRIGMVEVLLDETKTDEEQLVIEYGELSVPSNADKNSQNNGSINLSGGDHYLITTFENFSQIKAYTLCAFDEVIQSEGSTVCTA